MGLRRRRKGGEFAPGAAFVRAPLPPMPGEPHYEYRFEDRSLLLRLLQGPVLDPLVRRLPRTLTPNQLTLLGQFSAWAGFAAVLLLPAGHPAALLTFAAGNLLFMLCDCLDGMFARHTGRTSRTGEMLDHWLDAVSVPLLPLGFGLALQQPPWLVLAATAVVSFLHFATFLHGYRAGFVHLGALGIIEGIVVAAAACVGTVVFGPNWLTAPLVGPLSIAGLLMAALTLGSLAALGGMRGLLRHPGDFAGLGLLFVAILAWRSFGALPPAWAGLLLIAVGACHEGKIIAARLLRRPLRRWDAAAAGAVVGAAAGALLFDPAPERQISAAAVVLAVVLLRGGNDFFRTLAALRCGARL